MPDDSRTPRILIVEDEPDTATLVSALLSRKLGARTVVATDCTRAAEILSGNDFDCITLDYQLPDRDGLSFLAEIATTGSPPVIMVTGQGDEEVAARCFELGGAGYVVKDRRLSTMLAQVVGRILDLQASRRAEERNREELEHERRQTKEYLDLAGVMMVILDRDARIQLINRKGVELLGYDSESDLLGRDWFETCLPEPERHEVREVFDQNIRGETSLIEYFENPVITASGEKRLIAWRNSTVRDPAGNVVATVSSGEDITERRRSEEELKRREELLRTRLDSVLSPDSTPGGWELSGILDVEAVQSLMDRLYPLTGIGMAIVDMKGNVLVKVGWQDVCTLFHRVNPETAKNCTESDLYLQENVREGEFVVYQCRNGMNDVVSPIFIGERHVANIYTGQFFYDDQSVDEAHFAAQAEKYGFDREAYLEALRRVPRFSAEKVNRWMEFLVEFAGVISRLSFSNLALARARSRQRSVEDALRDSEERLEAIFTSANDGIVTLSDDRVFTSCNEAACEILGYTAGELIGRHAEKVYRSRGYTDEVGRRVYPVVNEQGFYRGELEILRPDGGARTVEISISRLTGGGISPGVVCVFRDVTERREAEEELQRVNAELKGYAHNVSHDMKGPLSAALGAKDLLEEMIFGEQQPGVEAGISQALQLIGSCIQRAYSLVEDLLVLAEAGNDPVRIDEVDTVAVVEMVIAEHSGFIEEKGVRVVIDPGLENVRAQDTHMYQLWANLIDNALRYGRGSPPVLGITRLEERSPGVHRFLVRDNGPGIPRDLLGELYTPFTRGEDGGTGIGMTIVGRIVNLYGGEIRAYNDGGACIEFTIRDFS